MISSEVASSVSWRFDSILVRLKVAIVVCSPCCVQLGFDSILVRLKEVVIEPAEHLDPSFDSILVRLKVPFGIIAIRRFLMFRFHTGSIKSPDPRVLGK